MPREITPAEIGGIGERYAVADLEAQGWTCYRNTQLPGATDIEAISKNQFGNVTKRLLVQVKTAISPNVPADLNADDKRAIVSRAGRNDAEAWLAQMSIDKFGGRIGSNWKPL